MQYETITTDQQLTDFCERISSDQRIALDTEFVSEHTYHPELCLIQIAAGEHLAAIDTCAIEDISALWQVITQAPHETIVHAGREELRFCVRAAGKRPHCLSDIQIAAGLIGLEYPAAYGTLISKLLGKTLPKGETRTDWRRRPLSQRQLDYAVQDVLYLEPLHKMIRERLEKLGRTGWLATEMASWQDEVDPAESRDRWRRVSGIGGLSARSLAVVRELWQWRDGEADRRNMPPKRVLRDDLIVELARRQTADIKRIQAVRGLQRSDLQRQMPQLALSIERALALDENQYPRSNRRAMPSQLAVLGQFLATALGNVCRQAQLAPGLVGSVQDVRDLIAFRLGLARTNSDEQPPRLAQGWRAEIVGEVIDDFLAGRLSIRIHDPLAEQPLVFEPYTGDG